MNAEQFYKEQVRIGNISCLNECIEEDYVSFKEFTAAAIELFFLMENYAHFKNGVE